MKELVLMTVAALFISNAQANVECTKDGRFYYPTNEVAKDIAAALKVKTCNGKRFAKMVAKLGMKSNVVKSARFSEKDLLKKYKK